MDLSLLPLAHPCAPGGAIRRVERARATIEFSAEMAANNRILLDHATIVIVAGASTDTWPS